MIKLIYNNSIIGDNTVVIGVFNDSSMYPSGSDLWIDFGNDSGNSFMWMLAGEILTPADGQGYLLEWPRLISIQATKTSPRTAAWNWSRSKNGSVPFHYNKNRKKYDC